jgi:NTP pyrophosphatase (non-canonical NTP hydrolase)
MKLPKFQRRIGEIIHYDNNTSAFWLTEEAGECAKIFKHAAVSGEMKHDQLREEIGDVLTALAALCNAEGLDLHTIAQEAVDKWKVKIEEKDIKALPRGLSA